MGRVAAGAPQVPWNCRRKKPEHSFFSGTWRSFVGLELSAHDCLRFDGRTDRKKRVENADGSHLDWDMDFCLLALAYKPWNTGFKPQGGQAIREDDRRVWPRTGAHTPLTGCFKLFHHRKPFGKGVPVDSTLLKTRSIASGFQRRDIR